MSIALLKRPAAAPTLSPSHPHIFYGMYNCALGNTRTDTDDDRPLRDTYFERMPERIALLRAGDAVRVVCPYGYGHHSAHLIIDRMNPASFSATEMPNSYSPNRRWKIHHDWGHTMQIACEYMPHKRLMELAAQGWDSL